VRDRGCGLETKNAGDSGQASVEFVGLLPALAVCLILAAQGVAAAWALWAAGNAARAGARAEQVGTDAARVARQALPGLLRDGARISDDDGIRVSVRVPGLLPGVTMPTVDAASKLGDAGS
jgi:pilus assembly protein CpaE